MRRSVLVPLGLAVTGLLVVTALASRGRPLSSSDGAVRGASPTFFDYVFTTIVILGFGVLLTVLWGLLTAAPDVSRKRPGRDRYIVLIIYLTIASAIAWGIASSGFQKRFARALHQHAGKAQPGIHPASGAASKTNPYARNARIRWDEVAVALALLAGLGVAVFAAQGRHRLATPSWRASSQRALSDALDESLDDLRAEPDLRKAIIAAYARMERTLAAAGLPRNPAETPVEYMERALRKLETSPEAVRRLTDLFEWAKFSQHEPVPSMRDDAIDALVAIRDELRRPAEEPALV